MTSHGPIGLMISALRTDKHNKKQVVAPRRHEEHEVF